MNTIRAGKSVRITNLSKFFADQAAVDRISVDVPAGAFCTLLGPSGSGKTTLLKMIAGYELASEGRIEIDGRDIASTPVAERNIGMVFQNYALFPHMTVAGNLAFPLEVRRTPRSEISSRVQEMLDLVGLSRLGGRFPRELSGGQQQRVALARALIFSPDILLMDEPLGALDKNLRQSMQREIKRIHRQVGVTVIYVTHDQEEAINLSDTVVVMKEGRIIQIGTPRDIYDKPETVFVATFLGDCNLIQTIEGPTDARLLEAGDGVRIPLSAASKEARIVGIRPERLRVTPGSEGAEIEFRGVVRAIDFSGSDYRISIQAGSQTLFARLVNQGDVLLAEGQNVYASCALKDAVMLGV